MACMRLRNATAIIAPHVYIQAAAIRRIRVLLGSRATLGGAQTPISNQSAWVKKQQVNLVGFRQGVVGVGSTAV